MADGRRRLLVLLSLIGCAGAQSPASRASAVAALADPTPLLGTWELVSTRMTRGDTVLVDAGPPVERSLKILDGTHYSVITLRNDQFMRAGAGRYTLTGDRYTESVEIASGRYTPGRVYTFRVRVNEDRWTIDGGTDSERIHEVWRRVR